MTEALPPPSPDWAYFLDLDGSLVNLAETPGAIQVDPCLKVLLEQTHRQCNGALAVVSGRSLADLDHHLGMGLPMAGQHGLERRTASGCVLGRAPRSASLVRILRMLQPAVARHPALLLENKGLTVALHYRRAPNLAAYAQHLMRRAVAGTGYAMQKGKCVAEARPMEADKGRAIARFMAEPPFRGRRPVFIGDDLTDEAGFTMVNRLGGLSIKVGPGATRARWRLPHVAAVRAWLAALGKKPGTIP